MKIKSRIKNVYFEKWHTPIGRCQSLWLSATLQTIDSVYFFFRLESDVAKDIHVMSFSRRHPYRMTDEDLAYGSIGKYLAPLHPKKERDSKFHHTYKLWGTNLIEDLDQFKVLSDYKKKRDKNIFEYLIITQDEWIEFILYPHEPDWKVFHDVKIDTLVDYYLKKSRSDSKIDTLEDYYRYLKEVSLN